VNWPWLRQRDNEEPTDATMAENEARTQLSDARQQRVKVAEAERAARALARQADALAREVEHALHRRHA